MIFRPLLVFVLAGLVLGGCAANPVTGKQNFVMMSEAQEMALGQQASEQIAQQMSMLKDPKLQAYVQRIGTQLANKSHRSGIPYQFNVIDSPDINAFALPGGHIYINRGLLIYLNSEAQMAAVLGHEIGHVTARHGVRQQSIAMSTGLIGQLITIGTGMPAAGDLSNMLGTAMVRGYGRDMELEADGLGAEYLARTGYRPEAVLDVIGALKNQDTYSSQKAAAQGKQVESYHGLFSTHPTHDQRLQQVVAQAQGLTTGDAQRVGRNDYLQMLDGMIYGDSPEQGIVRGQRFLHTELNMVLDYPKGWVILNRPDVLLTHTPDEQGFIALTMENLSNTNVSAEELLRARVGKQRLTQDQAFSGTGYKGFTATIPGDNARRVAAIVRGKQAFLFIGAFRGRGPLELYDEQFVQTIRSFRPLTAADKKNAQPMRIRLVRARQGDTYAKLAKGSPLGAEAEARLRLLNAHWPEGQPKAGQWLKVVR
ncbi:M48 family metalloprotease [Halopseudomonas sp.]|jgi:predicted Zn-dependent protease|uniref:M48 family metalloprotease n=1 Tax=Halopseudomonas sp. TaxID=2901191 RepID=UPI0039E6D573